MLVITRRYHSPRRYFFGFWEVVYFAAIGCAARQCGVERPSGDNHSYGESPFLTGKLTILLSIGNF